MDAFSDPLIEEVVVMSSAQIGKTEILNNVIGYFASQDPSPMQVIQPTLDIANEWSKNRLAPMLRDTPCLQGIVSEAKGRSSSNSILHKTFIGGAIVICGANSPASLAGRPTRISLGDEIDRWPVSAGSEGDPLGLTDKRTNNFWNRKKGRFSTPTIKGISRIEKLFHNSDMRLFHVPCLKCGTYQVLKWGNVKWEKGKPETARIECEHCGAKHDSIDRDRMVRKGQWEPQAETKKVAGFHLNELYSPWVQIEDMVSRFLEAKHGGKETLKVWVNTSLGEPWEDDGIKVDDGSLMARAENYGEIIPQGGAILTAGVDVQAGTDSRLEVEVVAWGKDEESWSMDYKIFYGNPELPDVWNDLDVYLQKKWKHESGTNLSLASCFVDSGANTKAVYRFTGQRGSRRIYASKGRGGAGVPIVSRASKAVKTRLFHVGVDTAKDSIFARLQIEDYGPGYCHFPENREEEYYKQLTAEKQVLEYKKGTPYMKYVKTRTRNEALDCRVYALAALAVLNANLNYEADRLAKIAVENKDENKNEKEITPTPPKNNPKPKRKNRFVSQW